MDPRVAGRISEAVAVGLAERVCDRVGRGLVVVLAALAGLARLSLLPKSVVGVGVFGDDVARHGAQEILDGFAETFVGHC